MGLETRNLRLGFIALNDSAPLVVARELGFFENEGLSVELSREGSWATVRDKVAVGALDGGHMLGPMTLAASMGIGGERTPLIVPFSMNLNGSAVTVSKAVASELKRLDPTGMAARPRSAKVLRALIDQRKAEGEPPLTFAVVFAYSMHAYILRYWLAEGGIDPDREVRLIVAPPARMAERLKAGDIDGFCVSAPWNAYAAHEGDGEVLIFASDFWRVGPDKVFGVTRAWADENPTSMRAVIRALIAAAAWADEPANRPALASILARPTYVDAPEEVVALSLTGAIPYAGEPGEAAPDYIIYSRYAANFPWRSHALWFLTQMLRWGQIGPEVDVQRVATNVYRPDLYRMAAEDLGVAAPLIDYKTEGGHARRWVLEEASAPISMAPDRFFDGRIFDPHQPAQYAAEAPFTRFRPRAAQE